MTNEERSDTCACCNKPIISCKIIPLAAMLKEQIDADVEERLIELDAEGEAFNRECWDALKTVCESRPGFDWKNYNNEMTAQEAADFLFEEFRELDERGS